jgi:2-methylcitrate dehydratase PrpD
VARLKLAEGLLAEQVAEVECLVPAGEVPIVCEPVAAKLRPRTPYDTKFSLAFCVAAALTGERVRIGAFTKESIRESRVLALAARVRYTVDPVSPDPRTFPGWVKVRLADGRVLEAREESQRGGVGRPIAAAEVIAKFRDNTARLLPPPRVSAIEEAVLGMEAARDLGSLADLCRLDRGRGRLRRRHRLGSTMARYSAVF